MLNLLPKKGCAVRSLMATSCCERASSRSYSFPRAKLKDLGLMFPLGFNRLILNLHYASPGSGNNSFCVCKFVNMYANFCQ